VVLHSPTRPHLLSQSFADSHINIKINNVVAYVPHQMQKIGTSKYNTFLVNVRKLISQEVPIIKLNAPAIHDVPPASSLRPNKLSGDDNHMLRKDIKNQIKSKLISKSIQILSQQTDQSIVIYEVINLQ
jgi:hypothetical protein